MSLDRMPVYAVLGATGGIGSLLARRLAEQGAHLALAARGEDRLRVLGEELGAFTMQVDATQIESVDAYIQNVVETYGQVDGIVNCVGSILLKPAHLTSEEEWRSTIAQNLDSAFAVVRAAGRSMRRNGGVVVLLASAVARVGLSNHESVAAAKSGVIGLARSAAATYASKGIRFNVVSPGLVQTPMSERITSNEASRKLSESLHALGRLGEPDDIVSMILWLLDLKNDWVTGQVFGVDGGLGTIRAYVR
ncbi:MAG: SDR family oxidoreductase [Chloroflexi bacterium]|nr:SDR family oxidoreductase [Chloroflexota bacterium]